MKPVPAMASIWAWTVLGAVATFSFADRPAAPWAFTAVHIATYCLMALPVLVMAPQTLRDFSAGRRQILWGSTLVVAATGYAAAVVHVPADELAHVVIRMGATALAEELVFRGYLWDRGAELLGSSWRAVILNVALFVGSHVPLVIAEGDAAQTLAGVTVLGLVFAVLRLKTGGLALPTFVHWAVDIAGR